jgi:hypothetical protein
MAEDTNITSKGYVDPLTQGKATRVVGSGLAGNLAALTSNGDLANGGSPSQFATASQGAKADAAIQPSQVANNLTVNQPGQVLDARQGKTLFDMISAIESGGRMLGVCWTAINRDMSVFRVTGYTNNHDGNSFSVGDKASPELWDRERCTQVIGMTLTVTDVGSGGEVTGKTHNQWAVVAAPGESVDFMEDDVPMLVRSGSGNDWTIDIDFNEGGTILQDFIDQYDPSEGDEVIVMHNDIPGYSTNTWLFSFIDGSFEPIAELNSEPRNFANDPIQSNELQDGAVTTSKIVNESITAAKAAPNTFSGQAWFSLAGDSVTLQDVASNSHVLAISGLEGITLDGAAHQSDWDALAQQVRDGDREWYIDIFTYLSDDLWYYLQLEAEQSSYTIKLYNLYNETVVHTFYDGTTWDEEFTLSGFENATVIIDITPMDVVDEFEPTLEYVSFALGNSRWIDFKDEYNIIMHALTAKVEIEQDPGLAGFAMGIGADGYIKPIELDFVEHDDPDYKNVCIPIIAYVNGNTSWWTGDGGYVAAEEYSYIRVYFTDRRVDFYSFTELRSYLDAHSTVEVEYSDIRWCFHVANEEDETRLWCDWMGEGYDEERAQLFHPYGGKYAWSRKFADINGAPDPDQIVMKNDVDYKNPPERLTAITLMPPDNSTILADGTVSFNLNAASGGSAYYSTGRTALLPTGANINAAVKKAFDDGQRLPAVRAVLYRSDGWFKGGVNAVLYGYDGSVPAGPATFRTYSKVGVTGSYADLADKPAEAPTDGKLYGMKSGVWSEVKISGPGAMLSAGMPYASATVTQAIPSNTETQIIFNTAYANSETGWNSDFTLGNSRITCLKKGTIFLDARPNIRAANGTGSFWVSVNDVPYATQRQHCYANTEAQRTSNSITTMIKVDAGDVLTFWHRHPSAATWSWYIPTAYVNMQEAEFKVRYMHYE